MIKDIILGCVFVLVLYSILGGYIVAMFNGVLPGMENHEPPQMCVVFKDGTTYGRDSKLSIAAYHERTGQSFDYRECRK